MIRRIQMSLNEANTSKLNALDELMAESLRVINAYIDKLWADKTLNKFSKIEVNTWLSARMKQCLLKQAYETVKSQKARKNKTKPTVQSPVLNLDERFLSFSEDINSFDFWIKLSSIGNKIIVKIPSRKHKHFLKYRDSDWKLRKGGRLRKCGDRWFLDLYMEKESPAQRMSGESIGIDTGYKKLIACSTGQVLDAGMESIYNKIARKKQGSIAFKRALTERDNLIRRSVNTLLTSNLRSISVENLKDVKKGSKGKIRKQFNNKLQRWSYVKVLQKLERVCEEAGILFKKVDPAYTSQTCSSCGHVDKLARKGERYSCTRCNMSMDADINAAVNILQRGAYSPPSL